MHTRRRPSWGGVSWNGPPLLLAVSSQAIFFSRNKIFLTSHERAPREQRTHAGDDASHLEPSQARPNFLNGPVPFLFPWGRRLRPKNQAVLCSAVSASRPAARRAGTQRQALAIAVLQLQSVPASCPPLAASDSPLRLGCPLMTEITIA
ncbi:hypothetical protein SETIT_6G214200v2 [Setaria italica]|uniref:Uncharacterized protein n=1 Tax=Setaria italica TaxID=4555 RepID=A0A368RQP8_SETIT|nr:hypothetical protein SETIT_6G214200v2 [Setaria italica]